MEKHLKRIFANFEEIIASLFLAVMVTVLVANVVLRLSTSRSLLWMEEIAYLCFAWVVFVGAAAGYKRNLHSSIDMIIKFFPENTRRFVAILGMLLTLATCIIMVILSFNFSIQAWDKYTPFLYIRYTFIDISVTVGFLFTCVHSIVFIKNMILYKDFTKERLLYANIFNLDILLSGATETVFHAESAEPGASVAGEKESD